MRLKAKHYAEMHGSAAGQEMVEGIFNAQDQAEAVHAIMSALQDAFNINDKLGRATSGGFAVAIASILERGRDAIRAEPVAGRLPSIGLGG